jgi:hypothetical protein
MKKTFLLAPVLFSMLAVHAGAKSPAPSQPKIAVTFTWQAQDDPLQGVLHVVATAQPAQPGADYEGKLVAILDDQAIVGSALMDAQDHAVVAFDLPRDGKAHEACLKFSGSATTIVRGKPQVQAIEQEECRTLVPLGG